MSPYRHRLSILECVSCILQQLSPPLAHWEAYFPTVFSYKQIKLVNEPAQFRHIIPILCSVKAAMFVFQNAVLLKL